MKKPRSVKEAFESDFIVKSICCKYSKKIRVDFKRRFHRSGECNEVSFWIDRDYFARTYPNTYARF